MSAVKKLSTNVYESEGLTYTKSDIISLKNHPHFNENWLHQIILKDPSIIGLGELDYRDHERRQPRAGRLDLLLEDVELKRRYEVEIQLGQTDESHLIRTIEYWDTEKKRFPHYDHCAVIIAEDVTSRFLNVISLFNGHIPIVAIQVKAVKIKDSVSLFFTTILNEIEFGFDEEHIIEPEKDRGYWETKGTPETLKLVDSLLSQICEFSDGFSLKYNKHYIGLQKNLRPQNFVIFKPQKTNIRLSLKCKMPDEMVDKLKSAGFDVYEYNLNWKEHPISVTPSDIKNKKNELLEVMKYAFDQYYL